MSKVSVSKLGWKGTHSLITALIFLTLFIGSRVSDRFLDRVYLLESVTLFAEVGIVALVLNFVIASGVIDLSVGSITVLVACLYAKLSAAGQSLPVCLLAAIGAGAALGWTNVLLVKLLNAPAFLVTVATLALYRGIAQVLMGPQSVEIPESWVGIDTQTFVGLTIPLWILFLLAILIGLVFDRHVFGRETLAIGSNEEAARNAGVNVSRTRAIAFVIAGVASAVAGVLMVSRLGLARHEFSRGMELDAITMVVVGGTSIRGGKVDVLGTVLAFLLISLVRTVMGIANLPAEYQFSFMGLLLIAAVAAIGIQPRKLLLRFRTRS